MGGSTKEPFNRFVRIQGVANACTTELSRAIGLLSGKSVQAAIEHDTLWIRYSASNEKVVRVEALLPGQRWKACLESMADNGDLLAPLGKQVATERLPADLNWSPLEDLIQWRLPTAALSGHVSDDDQMSLRLVRSSVESKPAGAMVEFQTLQKWLETAPAIRLQSLEYCVDAQAKVCLVLGEPLPPIPCRYLWDAGDVFVPAGMCWAPAVDAVHVREAFGVGPGEMLAWFATDDWSVISRDNLMPLRRSSFRALLGNRLDENHSVQNHSDQNHSDNGEVG